MNGKGKFTSHKGSKFQEGQSVFIKQRCKFINCFITYDKYLLHKDHRNFDAVVFNSREIVDLSPNEIDLTRSVDQKYIFRSLQFPEDYPICNQFFDNFFNWTWTYNLDSDIPQPLLNIFNSDNKLVGPKKNMTWTKIMDHNSRILSKISSKKKGIAWIVNKCKNKVKHQEFVRELSKELKLYNYTIDIYGTCGDNKCPGSRIINCLKMVEKNYFFQLIMEDTFAEDYVSEKMVKAMTRIVIPIVLGSSDYNK
nr:alpha-(1,3)-fucosyltransferase C-like [Vanessa tameamea]